MDIQKNIIVVSGPVVIRNGKVWLNRDRKDNFWKFLGGKVSEKDLDGNEFEVLERACIREVKEENDLDIEIVCPLKTLFMPKQGDANTFVVLVHWLARPKNEVSATSEIEEVREFDIQETLNGSYQEVFAPNIVPILKHYMDLVDKGILKSPL